MTKTLVQSTKSAPDKTDSRPQHISPFKIVTGLIIASLTALIIYPLFSTLWNTFIVDGTFNTKALENLAAQPQIGNVVLNTVIIVGVSVPFGLLFATLLAWLIERTDARIGWVSTILPLLPLMVPALVGSIGWSMLLSPRTGLLNVQLRDWLAVLGIQIQEGPIDIFSWGGMIFLYVLFVIPFGYIVIAPAIRSLDPSVEEASRVSGAGIARTLWRVTLPSIKPALAGAFTMQLIIALAMFAVPATVGTPGGIEVLSVRIYRILRFGFPPQTDVAVIISLGMLAVVGIAFVVQRRITRTAKFVTIGGKVSRDSLIELGVLKWPAKALIIFFLIITSLLPITGLLLVSLQGFLSTRIDWSALTLSNYKKVFAEPELSAALTNSILFGIQGGLIAMLLAVVLALYLSTNSNIVARLAGGIVALPSTIPPLAIAVAFIAAFAGPPFNLGGTAAILLGAYIVMIMPQAMISASSSIGRIGTELIEASSVAGAGRWRTFRSIIFPLILPGFIAGFAVCFVLTAGEVTGSVLLAGLDTPVVGYELIKLYESGTSGTLAAMGMIVTVLFSVITMLALRIGRTKKH